MNLFLDVVSKAVEDEPDGAVALMDEVVYDVLAKSAAEIDDVLRPTLGAWAADRIAAAKRQLGRSYVETLVAGRYPDEEFGKAARWLADLEEFVVAAAQPVSKAVETWNLAGTPSQRQVFRDAQGRFRRGVNRGTRVDPRQYGPGGLRMLSPVARSFLTAQEGSLQYRGVDESRQDRIEAHQSQWEQANEHLAKVTASFTRSQRRGIDAVLTVEGGDGHVREITFPLADLENGSIPADADHTWKLEDSLISIEVAPNEKADDTTWERVAQFNSLGAAGGMALAQLGNASPDSWSGLARTFTGANPNDSRLTTFFNRLKAGGRVLRESGVSEKYGRFAEFVGTAGPVAEQVLGPAAQKAAYRYRGTEKTPDADLTRAMSSRQMDAVAQVATKDPDRLPELADVLMQQGRGSGALAPGQARSREVEPVGAALAYNVASALRSGEPISGDQMLLHTRADVAAHHLMSTFPDDPFVARVSQASGATLPSQGVIIDADGDVVSQAVGYGDDHYLPFDLTNLSRLRGGQYVRTRQQGGLTAEDVYTAIRTGARMATVVSSSGVYSIEFDPNFRGMRASGDVPSRMTDRYIRILDAVNGSGLYSKPLPAAQRAKIRADAERIGETPAEIRELEAKAKESAQADPRWRQLSRSAQARLVEEHYEDLESAARDEAASQLTLNGEGYAVALQTLQQQFPYFVRKVTHEPLGGRDGRSFFANRGLQARGPRARTAASDTGYVGPRDLRARGNNRGQAATKAPRAYWSDRNQPAAPSGGEPAPAPEQSAGAAQGQPTARQSAPSQPAPQGPSAPPSTASRLGQRIAADAPRFDQLRAKEARTFANDLGGLALEATTLGADTTWETAGERKADFIIEATPDNLVKALDEHPDEVAAALTDVDGIRAALMRAHWPGGNPADFFASGNTLMGARDIDGAAQAIAARGRRLADLSYLATPFAAAAPDPARRAFHTGLRAQDLPDIAGLDSSAALAGWTETPDGARAVQVANELAIDSPDSSLTAVGQTVSAKVDTLRRLGKVRDDVRNAARAAGGREPANAVDAALQRSGLDRQTAAAALGVPPDKLDPLALEDADVIGRATDLQRAWTLVTAARSLQWLDGESALPKALRGLADSSQRPVQPVAKSLPRPRVALKLLPAAA